MIKRKIGYTVNGYYNDLDVEIILSDNVKIPESAINKSLMIAMNYLIENMETEDQEEPE